MSIGEGIVIAVSILGGLWILGFLTVIFIMIWTSR